jgi:hypothetical protein
VPLLRPWKRLSWQPLPSTGNLLPGERLRFSLPVPSEQDEIDAVLRLNAQVNKSHRQRFAVDRQGGVCSYIARETGRISRRKGDRGLSNRPLYQPLRFVVVVGEPFLRLTSALKLLFCHIAEKLNVVKSKEILQNFARLWAGQAHDEEIAESGWTIGTSE